MKVSDRSLRQRRRAQRTSAETMTVWMPVSGAAPVLRTTIQRTLELPAFPVAYWGLGLSYEQKGMLPQSLTALEKARELAPRSLNTLASLGYAYAIGGDQKKARAILEDLRRQSKLKYVSAYQIALVHVGLGERDEAMHWLEQAFDERATLLTYVGGTRGSTPCAPIHALGTSRAGSSCRPRTGHRTRPDERRQEPAFTPRSGRRDPRYPELPQEDPWPGDRATSR